MPRIPDSLRALMTKLIDYAGLYPPAALPLAEVVENYERYVASPDSWVLNRLVLPSSKLSQVHCGANWRVTLLVDAEPGALPVQVETLETKLPRRLSLPTYCEAPIDAIQGAFAKVRTGGLTADTIPPSEGIADFLQQAAARRIPFKATAGLHHPIRSTRTGMHGFVNVFVAGAFAWQGAEREMLLDVVNDEDGDAFEFLNAELIWRGHSLTVDAMREARRDFAHSFGSCSFAEPIAEMPGGSLRP
jgi:hypothetical protein